MVTHGNILAHTKMITSQWGYDNTRDSLVTWLPPYHGNFEIFFN